MVSIPKRVSEALNLFPVAANSALLIVSIPKRVSEALNPKGALAVGTGVLFQSLKGFQRL